jgi:dolichyl-diphosphooligosaccharide--protein glycosyltransferase
MTATRIRALLRSIRLPTSQLTERLTKRNLFFVAALTLVVLIAVLLRLQPLNWGYTLSEFDPYFHYDVTEHIVANGFASWVDYRTDRAWYPWGRHVGRTSFPGLPMTSAALHLGLQLLGVQASVLDVCILFPVLFAALTCIVAFFLGREVGGDGVGLLAALFLAITPAYIGRTTLGFFDTETVGIFGILLVFLFYIRALKAEDRRWQLGYGAAAGLALGYVFASWGASRYPLSLVALFTFILLVAGRYRRRLLAAYVPLVVVALLIALQVPKLGWPFIREFESIAAIGVVFLLAMREVAERFPAPRTRLLFSAVCVTGLAGAALALWVMGFISLPIGKFLSVLNPLLRLDSPLVESVQEHRPATWASFYYQFGTLTFLAPLGIYFAFQRPTDEKLLLVSYAVTALYFSASMIRLTILLAPALCILAAMAVVAVLQPFADIAFRRIFSRRRLRFTATVSRGFAVVLVVVLFAVAFLPQMRGVDAAFSPTTLASSSLPVRSGVPDWSEALVWMKETLPQDAVVASWWDYGYWITVGAERISLADNGTVNATQIAQIGQMFMSNETTALPILKRLDADHVLVFTTLPLAASGQNLFGDEVKWRWMAKIGWNDNTADAQFEDTSITSQLAAFWKSENPANSNWYDQFAQFALPKSDSVLTKLMVYGAFGAFVTPEHFQLSFASSNGFVLIYEILYS